MPRLYTFRQPFQIHNVYIIIPEGVNWSPIGATAGFYGSYNGGGFSISNLAIDRPSNDYQGLFRVVNGEVKNLALLNVNITGQMYVGGVAGLNTGVIQKCYVTGKVAGSSIIFGGVAGMNAGIIENCYTTCDVSGVLYYVGGVVGRLSGNGNGVVQNCYATGNITGRAYVGGVAGGREWGTVKNCVALNKEVKATDNTTDIGRVAGSNLTTNGSLINNYGRSPDMVLTSNGVNVSLKPDASGLPGADVTSDNYGSQGWWSTAGNWSSGGAWDFTEVWEWNGSSSLPVLREFK